MRQWWAAGRKQHEGNGLIALILLSPALTDPSDKTVEIEQDRVWFSLTQYIKEVSQFHQRFSAVSQHVFTSFPGTIPVQLRCLWALSLWQQGCGGLRWRNSGMFKGIYMFPLSPHDSTFFWIHVVKIAEIIQSIIIVTGKKESSAWVLVRVIRTIISELADWSASECSNKPDIKLLTTGL